MARAIWSGAISFGLVNVPVKLYSAVSKQTVRFHQLNGATGMRIQQKRVDPSTDEEVAYDELVKGYEIAPEHYVIIEPGELDALSPKKTKTIDIEDFVELADIDPIFFDSSYYLAPGPGAAKAYALLRDAMQQSGKVAVARVVIRQRESLVAIRASGRLLTMATLLFADEVVDPDRIDELDGVDTDVKATKRELTMARQLIESLESEWKPDKYHDEYRAQVVELIEHKAQGKEIAVAPDAPEAKPVPDLMAALEASIQAARGGSGTKTGSDTKRPAKSSNKRDASAKSKPGSKAKTGSKAKPASARKR